MSARIVLVLASILASCGGPTIPAPGTGSNGTFLFVASRSGGTLDALAVASRDGRIFVGTSRDLRLIQGSKLEGFSDPGIIEIDEGYPAEVNGLAFGASGTTLYVGYSQGIAVLNVAAEKVLVTARVVLPRPVAKLYRDGGTLLALSFENELSVFSVATTTPVLQGTLALAGGTGSIRSATLQAGKATFSAPGAVWVVDYSNPAAPVLVATHALALLGSSVRGAGHLFTGNTGALSVVAMPDDLTATPVGPAAPPWRVPGAAPLLAGSRLYMVDDETGFVYLSDVSSPTAPVPLTHLRPDRERVRCTRARQTLLDDDGVLWVACDGGLVAYVIDY